MEEIVNIDTHPKQSLQGSDSGPGDFPRIPPVSPNS